MYNDSQCSKWTLNSGTNSVNVVLPTGYTTQTNAFSCASVLPLACCD